MAAKKIVCRCPKCHELTAEELTPLRLDLGTFGLECSECAETFTLAELAAEAETLRSRAAELERLLAGITQMRQIATGKVPADEPALQIA